MRIVRPVSLKRGIGSWDRRGEPELDSRREVIQGGKRMAVNNNGLERECSCRDLRK